MLWLCIYLPQLSLAIFQRACAADIPLAIAQGNGAHAQIVALNNIAQARGVRVGMRVRAAQALCAALEIQTRSPEAEAQALARLGAWASRFSSQLSVNNDALLLEIAGSLRLFGGQARLLAQLRGELAALGYRAVFASAPTRIGAYWLARSGNEIHCTQAAELLRALARLPLSALDLAPAIYRDLSACGLSRLGECLQLPRAGLARRFGAQFVEACDRACGRAADSYVPFSLPRRFSADLNFPNEVHDSEGVLFGAQRLLLELEAYLRARDSGVQVVDFIFTHPHPPVTPLRIKLAAPRRGAQHWLGLLRERLHDCVLRDSVVALALRAQRVQTWRAGHGDLFGDAHDGEAARDLWERLQARIGSDAVQTVNCVAAHRPERAWRYSAAHEPCECLLIERPLWLLPQPQPLVTRDGNPCLHGALQILRGPERIEGEWWEEDIARDYFVAQDPHGARYWLFRERRAQDWFLHGIFA